MSVVEARSVTRIAVEILGPVRLLADGEPLPLTAQQRTVLATLAAADGHRCSVDVLARQLWQDAPPASGLNALRVLIRSIRLLAPAPIIITSDHAYALAESVEVDAREAEAALRACVAAAAAGDDVVAITWFAEGRRRVRGELLEDADGDRSAQRDAFEELLLEALEAVTDARIRLGTTGPAMAELLAAAAAHPLRETLQERVVRALTADGRRAEALDAYASMRRTIVELLGVEPGPRLRGAYEESLRAEAGAEVVRTSDVRTGLRTVPVPLIGRERELRRLERLLAQHRLVTLVGLGGVGKTRLAQAVVERRPGAAAFASLAAARADADTAVTLAGELGVPVSGDTEAALAAALRRVPDGFVLVVDNAEHLPAAAPLVDRLLAAAPALTVLATSRVPLGLPAEVRVTVDPLDTSPSAGALSPAAQLLLDRVRALGELEEPSAADRGALERIAARCSGLPLAIELAAARATSASVPELARSVGSGRDLLRDVEDPRTATLQRTVLDMLRALPSAAASTLVAAAAFAGGCTVARLAVAVGRPEAAVAHDVGVLRERGLLRVTPGESAARRFGVLEVVREIVLDAVTQEQADTAASGQLRSMLHWLRTSATTRDFPRTRAEFAEFLDERANLRVAMRRASAPSDVADLFVLAATGWFRADGAFEHVGPLEALLAGDHRFTRRQRSDLLIALVHLRGANGDPAEMALLDQVDALGDPDPAVRSEVLLERTWISAIAGDRGRAARWTEELESLPASCLDLSMQAQIVDRRAILTALAGRVDEAVALARAQIERCRAAGRELPELIIATNLSDLQLQVGRYEDAAATAAEVVATTHPAERHFRSFALTNRSTALQLAGHVDDAIESIRAALVLQNGTPNLALALMTTTVAACALAARPASRWAVAAGVGDEGRRRTGIRLQPAECRLQDERIPGAEHERDHAVGAALVRERGTAEAVAAVRAMLLAGG